MRCLRCGTECQPIGKGNGKTKYCVDCKVELMKERTNRWRKEKRLRLRREAKVI